MKNYLRDSVVPSRKLTTKHTVRHPNALERDLFRGSADYCIEDCPETEPHVHVGEAEMSSRRGDFKLVIPLIVCSLDHLGDTELDSLITVKRTVPSLRSIAAAAFLTTPWINKKNTTFDLAMHILNITPKDTFVIKVPDYGSHESKYYNRTIEFIPVKDIVHRGKAMNNEVFFPVTVAEVYWQGRRAKMIRMED